MRSPASIVLAVSMTAACQSNDASVASATFPDAGAINDGGNPGMPDAAPIGDGGNHGMDAPAFDQDGGAPDASNVGQRMACSGDGGSSGPATIVDTPFAAPYAQLTFAQPSIPCNVFDITSYGAKGDGTTKNTDAFRQAVANAAVAGGVVSVPAGNWLTGPIHLASNVELHLDQGATVLFSTDFADYGPPATPLVPTRWQGLDIYNWSPLVNCVNCTNVAITGGGTLYGQGAAWWGWKATAAPENKRMYDAMLTSLGILNDAGLSTDAGLPTDGRVLVPGTSGIVGGLRPAFVECNGCKNFLVQGVTIKDGPFWTVHPLYSENVIVRNVHILSGKEPPLDAGAAASNGDGIDPDSCKNVLIEDTTFDTSDDNIAIKSGLDEDGIYVGKPSERIVIRRVTSVAGHGAITFGSEMSGGINNVYATDSTLTGAGVLYPLRFKTLAGRGGTISNVWLDGITMGGWTAGGIIIDMAYNAVPPPDNPSFLPKITGITFSNLSGPRSADGGTAPGSGVGPPLKFTGISASPLENITIDTVNLAGAGSTCVGGPGAVHLTNVRVPGIPVSGTWTCP